MVSTVGLLSGIALADLSTKAILLSGTVLIFVEAFSMAAGSFLSEHSVEEYKEKRELPYSASMKSGAIMFFSYFISGFIPLFPYIFFSTSIAFWVSIIFSLLALFILGVMGGKMAHTGIFRGGFKMALVGGVAIVIGVVVGKFVSGL